MTERRPNRTLGLGHDEFWEWCEKGQLCLPECLGCGHLAWPIVETCDRCGGISFSWRRLSETGVVVSACAFYQDYYSGIIQIPYQTILVELDEGVMFIANPAGSDLGSDPVGKRVRMTFKQCMDDAGSFSLPVVVSD